MNADVTVDVQPHNSVKITFTISSFDAELTKTSVASKLQQVLVLEIGVVLLSEIIVVAVEIGDMGSGSGSGSGS